MKTYRCILVALAAAFGLSAVGCVQPLKARLTLPGRHSVVRDQLVVHSDFPLASHHRLIEELTARRVDVSQRLMLPVSNEPIHVYLFDSAEQFEAFMRLHHPSFPQRRAFFIETDTRLEVYAQWGDRVAEDLRHEVTHGYIHSVVPEVPLWLDEGLAEYFEVPRGRGGLNQGHLDYLAGRLRRGRWQVDLARMERLDPKEDMTQDEYAEAWAWVHFLLETNPARRELLTNYLHELRQHGSARPLSIRLQQSEGRPDEELMAHIRQL